MFSLLSQSPSHFPHVLTFSCFLFHSPCSHLAPSLEQVGKKLTVQPQDLKDRQHRANAAQLSIQQLMHAGLHLGHATHVWHPSMLPFIYGRRAGIHVINMEHTLTYLRRAMNVIQDISRRNGIILFVGARPFMQDILMHASNYCGQFYVCEGWVKGSLANHVNTLRKATKNQQFLQPDLVVVLDMMESGACLEELKTVNVPSIGLCDTDCDVRMVTYPVPGNDDSHASVELVAMLLANAARAGRQQAIDAAKQKKSVRPRARYVRS